MVNDPVATERAKLLGIDVGNTETKIGLLEGSKVVRMWRVRTERDRTADEFAVLFAQLFALEAIPLRHVQAVVIASVVPTSNRTLLEACRACFQVRAHLFRPSDQTLMAIATERPSEVGADLVAAAIAARERRGSPVIVITYGTATAIAAVNSDGAYAGVAIAPGIQIGLDALTGRAAKLPEIALTAPGAAIGRTTISAVQSGVLFGTVAQTEGMVARFRAELGAAAPVVASGGLAEVLAKISPVIDEFAPSLVLEGLGVYARSMEIIVP
jgi:type III pantothenate kinase